MKRLVTILVILLVLYLGLQVVFKVFNKGYDDEYQIKVQDITFNIKEISNFKKNNYYFEISGATNVFKFQIYKDFNKDKSIIKNIEYFKDDKYECILPIFIGDVLVSDMMCINNNVTYYYHDIRSLDNKLDEFIATINNYDVNKYIDNASITNIENLDVYKENLINNHYIGITNYKGIYNISKDFNSVVYNISLFEKDIYNQKLGAFVDKYYISADYNKDFEFNELNIIDLVNLSTNKITSDTAITLDGYIQGVVDNKVYLFDKDRKVQYEINPTNKSITKNSKDNIKYYNSGSWSTMSVKDASEELKFIYEEINYQNNEYERIDKIGNETGYYYLYKNNGNGYNAYKINIQDNEGLTYLFSTRNIDNIFYVDDYIYFINDSVIQVYSDDFGIRNLVKYKELEFNKNIIFNVYSK